MRPPGLDLAAKKARNILSDAGKTVEVLNQAMDKAHKERGRISKFCNELEMLFRMIRAWTRGEYRQLPAKAIISALAAVIYFLSPLDLIPDFIFGLGFLDDATVIIFVFKSIRKDVTRFTEWYEAQNQGQTIDIG